MTDNAGGWPSPAENCRRGASAGRREGQETGNAEFSLDIHRDAVLP
jgi:hypothetical protein